MRSELECPDLTKIGCTEAVARRMSWEGFQDLENIGIQDAPDVAEDDDDREWNQAKIQKNLDERLEKLGIAERMDSTEDSGIDQTFRQPWAAVETPQNELTQVNRHREIKSLTDTEKISVRK